jgi:glycosyltransferase involved in cell wall biosynthesis
MAAALAVAGTDISGVKEVMGSPEFLAPVGNERALAHSILRLADDPELCVRLGAENRERIVEEYDARRMCEEFVELIRI